MKIEIIDGFMPEKAHKDDAGYDIRAAEDLVLAIGECAVVRAGFKMELDKGIEAQIRSRSGLASKNQVIVLNSPGTVDPGYRGEVKVIMANFGPKPMHITAGDRIAQMVFSRIYDPSEIVQDKVSDVSTRGDKGFGSTGEK